MPRTRARVVGLETVNHENEESRQLITDGSLKIDGNGVPMQCVWCDDECDTQTNDTTRTK